MLLAALGLEKLGFDFAVLFQQLEDFGVELLEPGELGEASGVLFIGGLASEVGHVVGLGPGGFVEIDVALRGDPCIAQWGKDFSVGVRFKSIGKCGGGVGGFVSRVEEGVELRPGGLDGLFEPDSRLIG